MKSETKPSPEPMLTFASGGWVLLLAGILVLTLLVWAGLGVVRGATVHLGDGRSIASYGFDLSTTLVPVHEIVIGAEHRDYIQALDHPDMFTPEQVDQFNDEEYGKYLVSTDRVIGINIGGEARAYPLRMLDWHEIVNDTVGGEPVLVTYNGLCDSAVVFKRSVDGTERTFGVSGLLYNSNLLLYDRTTGASAESLWSQVGARAITGPAAGDEELLAVLPCELTSWADWRTRHAGTLVLAPNPDPARAKYYKRRTYGSYHSSDRLRFPVNPKPADDGRALKTPTIAVELAGKWHVVAIKEVFDRAGASEKWMLATDDGEILFTVSDGDAGLQAANDDGQPLPTIYAFWFAWFAMHPDATLE